MFVSRKTFGALTVAALAVATSAFAASAVLQPLDYTDAMATLDNFERGFYTPQVLHLKPSGGKPIEKPYGKLLHLRAEISEFSSQAWLSIDSTGGKKDTIRGVSQDLTADALNVLQTSFDNIRKNKGLVVVRICYDPWYYGRSNVTPEHKWVLRHVEQLAPVLSKNTDVIVALEMGMHGAYGEMHSDTSITYDRVAEATNLMLRSTPSELKILTRTGNYSAKVLGFDNWGVDFSIGESKFSEIATAKGDTMYRVGMFNDGYLGTQYDYGTWGENCTTSICREEGVAWLEKYSINTPYGGEALTTAGGYKKINTVDFLSYEGFRTHTSYLNIQWNNNLIAEWKVSEFHPRDTIDKAYESYTDGNGVLQNSAFKYIDDHLGYRYVLRRSSMMDSLGPGSLLQLDMKIQNVGFGNMTKKRPVTVVLRSVTESAGDTVYGEPQEIKPCEAFNPEKILCRKVVLTSAFDANGNIADYSNVQSKTVSDGINDVKVAAQLPDTLPEGKYAVYLRISQYGNWPADSNYSVVRFANDSAYYDKETGANYVGSFVLSKMAPVVNPSKELCPSLLPKDSNKESLIPQQSQVSAIALHLEIHEKNLMVQNARRVEIFDLMGHKLMVQDLQAQDAAIPLNKMPRGALLIRAYGAGTIKTQIINNK